MATANEMAYLLDGREYGDWITDREAHLCKLTNIVVVYGVSDDLMEFKGFIDAEIDCYKGTTVFLNAGGIIGTCDDDDTCGNKKNCRFYQEAIAESASIKAVWNEDRNIPCWTYETKIPHATFKIMDNGKVFCHGIVFSINNTAIGAQSWETFA